jgi:hypothetical protein
MHGRLHAGGQAQPSDVFDMGGMKRHLSSQT